MKRFLEHPFVFLLLPLCVIVIAISFYRFIVVADYIVSYEGSCDPADQHCFVGYDDDTKENYYYAKVQKYAPDAYAACGSDITDCASASICLPYDRDCSIIYCSQETALDDETCADAASTNTAPL